ncbi:hypothetical protein [Sinorhizobium chiapasense]|uniref:Uncharacterized protein n=1 Tax=Sinorhizobium chiapasense TaxID=501572 RepID=A0ABZ2BM02_9HYPH
MVKLPRIIAVSLLGLASATAMPLIPVSGDSGSSSNAYADNGVVLIPGTGSDDGGGTGGGSTDGTGNGGGGDTGSGGTQDTGSGGTESSASSSSDGAGTGGGASGGGGE